MVKKKIWLFAFILAAAVLAACGKDASEEDYDSYIYCLNAEGTGLVKEAYEFPEGEIQEQAEHMLGKLQEPSDDLECISPIPEEVENLFCIAEIKIICRRLSIYHLSERGGVVEIEFSRLSALNPDRVISLLRLADGKVQMDSRHMDKMRMQTSAVSLKDKALFILEQLRRLL